MHGFSETLFKGSIAEQMQLSAVSQRPRESTLHFPLFSFPWSGKLQEFPRRAKDLSLDVGDKNCLFSFGNYLLYYYVLFHLFSLLVYYTLFLEKPVYLLLLPFVSQWYFHFYLDFCPRGVLAKHTLVTIKAGQIKLSKSMLGIILMCPHLASCIFLISVFQRGRTREVQGNITERE